MPNIAIVAGGNCDLSLYKDIKKGSAEMLFIIGITQGRKDFETNQLMTCSLCGAYGRSSVKVCQNCGYMTDEDFDFCPKCSKRL